MDMSVLDTVPISKSRPLVRRPLALLGNRRNLRAVLYFLLVVVDVAAVRIAFSIGVTVKGIHWLSPNGVELGWLILFIHVLIGLRNGAFSREAIGSRVESIRRGTNAFLVATALICMLMFFQAAGVLVSRIAFGASIGLALVLIALARAMFLTLFVPSRVNWMIGELLIVEGVIPSVNYGGEVLDAIGEGYEPDTQSPAHLARLAERICGLDRVVVACADLERRSAWAMMLKCYDVTGEVLLDEGRPLGAIGVDRFRGQDTVVVARGPLSLGNRMKKRTMDVIVGTVALIFLSPLLLAVAIAIKLDSNGPAFFRQPRVGRANTMFNIYKFRSMRSENGDLTGRRSASRDDDRMTRIGAFIRKTSIDELPQIFNVLKGDMSIVGPRPHALGSLAGDKLFWQVDEAYWQRHQLKPGITGLAQVRGFRGATARQTDLENRLQADLEYVSGWSLWRDVKIIFATFRVIVHPQAY